MAQVNILCVDDEPYVLDVLMRLLASDSYAVATAPNGDAALDLALATFFHVAIVDLRIPGRDGIALLRELKAHCPDTEVIILTAYADMDSAIEALKLGAHDYLRKPIEQPDELRLSVARALEKQELRLANRRLLANLQAAQHQIEYQHSREFDSLRQADLTDSDREWAIDLIRHALWESLECDLLAFAFFGPHIGPPELRIYTHRSWPDATLEDLQARIAAETSARAGYSINPADLPLRTIVGHDGAPLGCHAGDRLRSLAVAPLEFHQHPQALLVVGTGRPNAFGPNESRILNFFAGQAAVVLLHVWVVARLDQLATHDGLTNLINHRHFYELLEIELARLTRYDHPLALSMADIDRFKRINDTYGHVHGDEVLRQVSALLRQAARRSDIVARYGGEEFVLLLPHTTADHAVQLAERLRQLVSGYPFACGGCTESLTLSFGVTALNGVSPTRSSELVRQADQALYSAKVQGGNMVCCYSATIESNPNSTPPTLRA
jgi:diguanylate cyclase (GGDEF)-like protein